MVHQRVEKWESKLNDMLRQVDLELEAQFGSRLPLHPARPANGLTSNPQQDGLFRVTASFTAGFGSTLGKGYVVHIEAVTLEAVPAALRKEIEHLAAERIGLGLKTAFPGADLAVRRDGAVWKIVGDLHL